MGEIVTPPSLHRYLYAFGNPTAYYDLDGYESISTQIRESARGCNKITCGFYALAIGAYRVGTVGFADVHDPVRDEYDEGNISREEYAVEGVGKGLAVAGVTLATGRIGAPLAAAAKTTKGAVAIGAATGFAEGSAVDAITQSAHLSTGVQTGGFDVKRNLQSGLLGSVIGGVAGSVKSAKTVVNAIKKAKDKAGQVIKMTAESAQNTAQKVKHAVKKVTNNIRQQGTKGIPPKNGRLAANHFEHLTQEFSQLKRSEFKTWKQKLNDENVSSSNIQDVIHHGSLKRGSNLWGEGWKRYYEEISGIKFPGKPQHAHHLVEKIGGLEMGSLNREILEEVNINPLLSRHNLKWAPSVTGQHGLNPQAQLNQLLQRVRGDRKGVIKVLQQWGEISKGR